MGNPDGSLGGSLSHQAGIIGINSNQPIAKCLNSLQGAYSSRSPPRNQDECPLVLTPQHRGTRLLLCGHSTWWKPAPGPSWATKCDSGIWDGTFSNYSLPHAPLRTLWINEHQYTNVIKWIIYQRGIWSLKVWGTWKDKLFIEKFEGSNNQQARNLNFPGSSETNSSSRVFLRIRYQPVRRPVTGFETTSTPRASSSPYSHFHAPPLLTPLSVSSVNAVTPTPPPSICVILSSSQINPCG